MFRVHAQHSGHRRDNRTHRAHESAEQNTLAAMAVKKSFAFCQDLRVPAKWPCAPQRLLVTTAQPIAEAVTGNGPGGGQHQNGLQLQPARGHYGADSEHDHRPGDNQTDQDQRFEECHQENRCVGQNGMMLDHHQECIDIVQPRPPLLPLARIQIA